MEAVSKRFITMKRICIRKPLCTEELQMLIAMRDASLHGRWERVVLLAAEAGEKCLGSISLLVIATCLGPIMFLENLNFIRSMSSLLVCELSHEVTRGSLAGQ